MELLVLKAQTLAIVTEDDISTVRRTVKAIAADRGFDPFATAAITTATSEMTRNVLVHAGGGQAKIEELSDGARMGIRIEFEDEGPGIDDLDRVLAGGFSTRRSLGLGVSGTKRLVDEFDLDTTVGVGTRITVIKWTRL